MRRALRRGDDVRHGEGLARAGDAEQHLLALALADAGDERLDRLRLVARGLELGMDRKAPPDIVERPRRSQDRHGVKIRPALRTRQTIRGLETRSLGD